MVKQTTIIRLMGLTVLISLLLLNLFALRCEGKSGDTLNPQAQARVYERQGADTLDPEYHKNIKDLRFKLVEIQILQRLHEIYDHLDDADDLEERSVY